MLDIKITLTQNKKEKPDQSKLGFGRYFTDHMFVMNYSDGAWRDPRIEPFHDLVLSPAAMVFHYAQEMFEGMKAYRAPDGTIRLFRPDMNAKRLNRTNDRMIIPQIPVEDFIQAVKTLVKVEEDWIPTAEGTSLYIRPFIIATDAQLGVHPAHNYSFIIICSPVGAYYAAGINPVKIFVERQYTRAVKGGTGFAKVGGNYAASLIGQKEAEDMGYAQVLWLDGIEHKYIDEVGAMNVFFVIDGEVITPTLEDGNILPGVTRDSCIQLLRSWGCKVTERKLAISEIAEANAAGKLDEAFGSGTAAVISPIGELNLDGNKMILNGGKIGPISQKLYDELTAIQWGKKEGPEGWSVVVD